MAYKKYQEYFTVNNHTRPVIKLTFFATVSAKPILSTLDFMLFITQMFIFLSAFHAKLYKVVGADVNVHSYKVCRKETVEVVLGHLYDNLAIGT